MFTLNTRPFFRAFYSDRPCHLHVEHATGWPSPALLVPYGIHNRASLPTARAFKAVAFFFSWMLSSCCLIWFWHLESSCVNKRRLVSILIKLIFNMFYFVATGPVPISFLFFFPIALLNVSCVANFGKWLFFAHIPVARVTFRDGLCAM